MIASSVAILRRQMDFDFGADDQGVFFYRGNPLLSSFAASLSAIFPPGEREFVRSVAAFRQQLADPTLVAQVSDFAAQEGQHARQHRLANAFLDGLGYGASDESAWLEADILRKAPKRSDAFRLAATVGAEHLTAVLGHFVLTHPEFLAPLPQPLRELFAWHAVEEIEHKAVAFDVYMATVGDRAYLRRVFVVATWLFMRATVRGQWRMLRRFRRRPTLREIAQATRVWMGPGGLIPSITRHYMDFFKPDFHPWQTDDRALIAAWQAQQLSKSQAA